MNGRTAKLLRKWAYVRKLSGWRGPYMLRSLKREWNSLPRPLRASRRKRTKRAIKEDLRHLREVGLLR